MQLSFTGAESAGVAWWAHIGGFAIGMAYAAVLAKRKPKEAEDE
jgi:membrane associated rhomboid family serine protease